MIEKAMYLTESPKLSVKRSYIHRRFPQDAGLTIDHGNFWKDIVVLHFGFQGERHFLSVVLNEQLPKVLHRF